MRISVLHNNVNGGGWSYGYGPSPCDGWSFEIVDDFGKWLSRGKVTGPSWHEAWLQAWAIMERTGE